MINPQPTDSGLKVANSILEELLIRNFSKNQIKVILLILRVSWACQSKIAIIPQYTKYFKACGINKSNIKVALKTLISNKVIFWNRETNLFEFNKHFNEWSIPYPNISDKKLIQDLIHINLKSFQNKNKVLKTRTELLKNENKVIEILELENSGKIDSEQVKGMPIDSIIDSIYNDDQKSHLTEQEKNFINELKGVENYPLDLKKDSVLFKKLLSDFPNVNLIKAIKAWATSKLDNPLNKNSNPRSQINTWIRKGQEWGQYPQTDNIAGINFAQRELDRIMSGEVRS